MQLTTHTDYSLRLLIYLSITDDPILSTVQAAAERYGISANHLAKVAQTLVQLGYIRSLRGRGGGIRLARSASEINIGEVVRKVENLALLECFGPTSSCPIVPACILKQALASALQAFLDVLDKLSLDDLVKNHDKLRKLLNVA
jgi:Rrf2 family nitric oxide-sensitive transcriptional repressor